MTRTQNRRPDGESEAAAQMVGETDSTVADDLFAWGGIILVDGRVISIAWLRGYPGAVASPPRHGVRHVA